MLQKTNSPRQGCNGCRLDCENELGLSLFYYNHITPNGVSSFCNPIYNHCTLGGVSSSFATYLCNISIYYNHCTPNGVSLFLRPHLLLDSTKHGTVPPGVKSEWMRIRRLYYRLISHAPLRQRLQHFIFRISNRSLRPL